MKESQVTHLDGQNEASNESTGRIITQARESILNAMASADLQVDILNFDMQTATPDSIESFFDAHIDSPTAQHLKDRSLAIFEIRERFSDDELLDRFFQIKAIGPTIVKPTPISFSVDFYNPIDWARVCIRKNNPLYGIPRFLLPKGFSATRGWREVEDKQGYYTNVEYHRGYGVTGLKRIKAHEWRHSINHVVVRPSSHYWQMPDNFDEDDDTLTEMMLKSLTSIHLKHLKDELSAFIVARNKPRLFVKYFAFLLGPLMGMYDFNDVDSSFWDTWRKRGLRESVIQRVDKELPNKLDIFGTLDRSYAAAKLLQQKGYSREWAVSFLCTEDNFMKDWLECAEMCPAKSD